METTVFLIDAGFGIRNYTNSMRLAGLNPDGIRVIFITHEHSDHISGLRKLTEKYQVPVYGSKGTLIGIIKKEAVSPQQSYMKSTTEQSRLVIGDSGVPYFPTIRGELRVYSI